MLDHKHHSTNRRVQLWLPLVVSHAKLHSKIRNIWIQIQVKLLYVIRMKPFTIRILVLVDHMTVSVRTEGWFICISVSHTYSTLRTDLHPAENVCVCDTLSCVSADTGPYGVCVFDQDSSKLTPVIDSIDKSKTDLSPR